MNGLQILGHKRLNGPQIWGIKDRMVIKYKDIRSWMVLKYEEKNRVVLLKYCIIQEGSRCLMLHCDLQAIVMTTFGVLFYYSIHFYNGLLRTDLVLCFRQMTKIIILAFLNLNVSFLFYNPLPNNLTLYQMTKFKAGLNWKYLQTTI